MLSPMIQQLQAGDAHSTGQLLSDTEATRQWSICVKVCVMCEEL